ncbi:MAG: PrsW family intramembrane metalloprotease [Planctomycetota bacterium]
MGPLLTWILVASAPAFFWLWLFYRRDRWEPEPKAKVLQLFALGMAVAAPVYFLERWLPGPATPLFDNLVRVALVEELFKLLPVWLFAFWHREFNEPMDGIVYMVACALGFATVENALYALQGGGRLLVFRAFTSTLAHVGFSGLLGYQLGVAKFRRRGGAWLVLRAFVVVVVLHGVYDLLLAYGAAKHAPDWVARGALALMVPTLLLLLWYATNLASKASPFRKPDRDTAGCRPDR